MLWLGERPINGSVCPEAMVVNSGEGFRAFVVWEWTNWDEAGCDGGSLVNGNSRKARRGSQFESRCETAAAMRHLFGASMRTGRGVGVRTADRGSRGFTWKTWSAVLLAVLVVTVLVLLMLFCLFYCLSNFFIQLLARWLIFFFSVFAVVSFMRQPTQSKTLFLVGPLLVMFVAVIAPSDKAHHVASYIEYRLRKDEFERDITKHLQMSHGMSQASWSAWNSNAITMREFVFSKSALPGIFPTPLGSGDCQRLSHRLDENIYVVFFVGCNGPLF